MATQTIYDEDSVSSNDGLSSRMSSLQMTPKKGSNTPIKRKAYLPLFSEDNIGYVSPQKRIKLTNSTPNITQKYASLSSNAFQSFTASSSWGIVESQDSVIILTPIPVSQLNNDHCYQRFRSEDSFYPTGSHSQSPQVSFYPTQGTQNSISEAGTREIGHQDPTTSESSGKSSSQDNPWAGMTSQDFSSVEIIHSKQDSSQETTISVGDEVDYVLTPHCTVSTGDGYVSTPFLNTQQSAENPSILGLPSDSLITTDSVVTLEIPDKYNLPLLSNLCSEYDKKLMDLLEKRPPIINNSIKNTCDKITREEISQNIQEAIWFLENEDCD